MTYIFDNYYYVHEGDVLYFNKKYGYVGQNFLFCTRVDKAVKGSIIKSAEDFCALRIDYVQGEDEPVKIEAKVMEEKVIENIKEVDLFNEEKVTDFDSMTKKELIAYIKENNLPIEINKVNKATLLDEIKKSLV